MTDPGCDESDSEARRTFSEGALSFIEAADAELLDDVQRIGDALQVAVWHLRAKGIPSHEIGGCLGGAYGAVLAAALLDGS